MIFLCESYTTPNWVSWLYRYNGLSGKGGSTISENWARAKTFPLRAPQGLTPQKSISFKNPIYLLIWSKGLNSPFSFFPFTPSFAFRVLHSSPRDIGVVIPFRSVMSSSEWEKKDTRHCVQRLRRTAAKYTHSLNLHRGPRSRLIFLFGKMNFVHCMQTCPIPQVAASSTFSFF